MNCPRCNTNLSISITQGIEIDHCPTCKGVWLDRGELEKIIERSGSIHQSFNHNNNHHDNHQNSYHHSGYENSYPHSKHKKSLWSELFDF